MSAYLFNGMDEWYEKHKTDVPHTKRRSPIPRKETNKEQAWVKKLHYGDEYNKNLSIVETHHIGGHTQKIFDNGSITCDCLGWIMKRSGIKRECVHCRELYGQLKGKPVPPKTTPKKSVVKKVELLDIASAIIKGMV